MQVDRLAYSRIYNQLGVFDASQTFGRLFGRGKDVLDLLHRMSTNDLKPLESELGRAALTVLTNEKGRVVDVLTVIRDETGQVMLVTSAGKEEVVTQWLDKFTIMEDAYFSRATERIQQFAVYGPRANDLLRAYTNENLITMPQMGVLGIQIANAPATLLKAQRIAESGWWIFVANEHAQSVKQQLESDVQATGGTVISNELYEVLRVESGIPKAPNELNEKHNPLETTLVSAVSFTKGCYIGQEVIARLDSYDKVQRHMMGLEFEISDDAIREAVLPLKIQNAIGDEIGEVTSIVNSPGLEKIIGLGYVRAAHANPGSKVQILLQEHSSYTAALVKLPFDL